MTRRLCLVLLFLRLLPGESHASCIGVRTPQEAYDAATVVFSGTVIERIDHSEEMDRGPAFPGFDEYVFKVESVWKGPIRDTFGIFPLGRFKIGETYFIYASVWGSPLTREHLISGGPCSRCVQIDQALWDRAVLREPYVVDSTKAPAHLTMAELEALAAGQGGLAATAKRALEDIRSSASSAGDQRPES